MERPSNTTLALIAGIGLLLLLLVAFAATRDADQDRIEGTGTFAADDPDLNRTCAGQGLYDQIKRALFRQAAQVRGSDAENYGQIAAAASVRMENPAAEGEEQGGATVACMGSLAIDLPPGITTVGGRRQLMTDIYYSVEQGGGGLRRVVQLRGADAIVGDLAGLTVGKAPPAPVPVPATPVEPLPDDPLAAEPEPAPVPPSPTAQPSFDCARAARRSERAVCADPGLASLDRAMAAEFNRAMAASNPAQQSQLRLTRDRFLDYRDSCPNAACIGAAYTDRIREIRDIASGRWAPQR